MKQVLCLMLLSVTAASAYQLGINYTESLSFPSGIAIQLATDNTGSIYLLTSSAQAGAAQATVTKLSADGKTLWQNQLGFAASAMAVDPTGGVYIVPAPQPSDTTAFVAKLNPTGTGLAWKAPVGFVPKSQPSIAVDSLGRVYFTAQYAPTSPGITNAYAIRLNAVGNAIDLTTQIKGTPSSIAIDSSGAAYIAGTAVDNSRTTTGFLTKITADGATAYYDNLALGSTSSVAVDNGGNVVLLGGNAIQRIDATGSPTTKTTVPGASALALDAAGNAYVTAAGNQLYPIRNSLATCRVDPITTQPGISQLLDVIAPDGSILQATYLPGATSIGASLVATTPNGAVVVSPSGGNLLLSSLSTSSSPVFSLACIGSAASLSAGPLSPGELVTLKGSGLGPQQGIQANVATSDRYPTTMGGVRVTFDGIPAPLLWVQDSQINAVAPWSLVPGQTTQVCVTSNNTNTNCLTVPLVQATPAVFLADNNFAAALNQDGTYNSASNPAAPGSIVTVYATGLGPITPAQPDGARIGLPLPANNLPLGVEAIYTLGIPFGKNIEVPFDVPYAGPAPTLVAGVSQINFRLAPFPSYGAIYLHLGATFSPGFSIHIAGQ